MKILISSEGEMLESKFDSRYGRAVYFCIFNTESMETKFILNEFANSDNAAGQKAAEFAAENGIDRVISGDFGPKAKDALVKYNIQMVAIEDIGQNVGEVIKSIKIN